MSAKVVPLRRKSQSAEPLSELAFTVLIDAEVVRQLPVALRRAYIESKVYPRVSEALRVIEEAEKSVDGSVSSC